MRTEVLSTTPEGDPGATRAVAPRDIARGAASRHLLDRLIGVRSPGSRRSTSFIGPLGVPIMTIGLIAAFTVLSPDFLAGSNIKNILSDAALPAIVAIGLTVCLVMNEFDLSIAAVASFATMLVSVLAAREGMPLELSILVTVAIALGVGLFNGFLVSYLGLSALIVTIAVASVLNGGEFIISHSTQIYGGYPQAFVDFARGDVAGAPNLVLIAGGVAILFWIMLERTTLGRHMRAVGGNSEAARIAGVNVKWTRTIGFTLCSLMAGFAGILYAGKQSVAYPLTGLNVLLPSFAAAFIGAATFKIGQFNIFGTVLGILIAGIIANGLLLLDVPAYATYIFQGIILLVALLFARIVARGWSA